MNKSNLEWVQREDGVIYCEPKGFEDSYYIYPISYEDNVLPRLCVLNSRGAISYTADFSSIDEAKTEAQNHLIKVIKPFLSLVN